MSAAKIRLSPREAEWMADKDFILTKNRILRQVELLLESVQEQQQEFISSHADLFLPEVRAVPPKISKGENYKGFPWRILDHPRFFGRQDIFAIRTMFWWGHYFSVTLHLSGEYKSRFAPALSAARDTLAQKGFFVCIQDDPWQHHFERDNYLPVADISAEECTKLFSANSFLKIGHTLPLENWQEADELLTEDFRLIAQLLSVPPQLKTG